MKRLIGLILLLVAFAAAHAEDNMNFYALSVKHGLSFSRVQSITKDKYGFMWFATRNGLNRYDGYRMHHYRLKTESNFRSVKMDGSGTVWARTNNTLCLYESRLDTLNTDIMRHLSRLGITETVESLKIDEDKNLWCWSKNHIYYYDFAKRKLKRFANRNRAGIQAFTCRNGKAYIMDMQGNVLCMNTSNGKTATRFRFHDGKGTPHSIYLDTFNRLWVYTPNRPLIHCYDMTTGRELTIAGDRQSEECEITQLLDDGNGYVWIATNAGIYKINGYNFTTEHIRKQASSSFSLRSNHICSLYKDDSGIIWVGTGREGVCYQKLDKMSFETHMINSEEDITCILEDYAGNVWLGTDGNGLIKIGADGRQTVFNTTNSPLASNFIVSSYEDKNGRMWIGTYNHGLYLKQGGNIIPFVWPGFSNESSPLYHVKKITQDNEGTVWFASNMKGLVGYTASKRFLHFDRTNSSLQTNSITDICSRDGRLWIATSYGLYVMDVRSKKISPLTVGGKTPLAGEFVECVMEDHRGLLWAGTQNGLLVYNRKKEEMTILVNHDGLSHRHILGLVEDSQHNVWAPTVYGLSRIKTTQDPTSGKISYSCMFYTDIDGLGDITFTPRSIIQTASGNIVAGGTGRTLVFKPNDTAECPGNDTKVVFTDLHVAGELVKPGMPLADGRILLNASLYMQKEITLDYSDHNFSIDVSTMNYGSEHKLIYQYRLSGSDRWTDLDGNRISFNQLSYGDYRLEVRVKNTMGLVISPSVLKIHIRPPFWLSTYACIIYLLAIMALCFYVYKRYQWNMAKKQRKLEYRHREEMNEEKMKFFTNVSHDLKTPLSLIVIPLEKIIRNNRQSDLKEDLLLMQRNVKLLKSEVNQLLEFRKLDQHKSQIVSSYGSLTDFIKETCTSFEPLTQKKGITLSVSMPDEGIEMDFDKEKMQRILMNLLSNAYKYNVENGKIEVKVGHISSETGEKVTIEVSDTGIGIKDENKEKVFDRFYQEKTDQTHIGNGIGLHIVKEYVLLHHGEITVTDNVPQGSVFTVTLPVTRHHAAASEETPSATISAAAEIPAGKVGKKILLVEDNDDFRKFMARTLADRYTILQAANGKEALDVMAEEDVDIVISDVMMPVMDGQQLCRKIKTDITLSHIPVILLTARSSDEHIMEGLKDGADDYITKPFNMEILILRIDRILEWTRNNHQKSNTMDVSPSEITVSSLDEQLMTSLIKHVEENMGNEDFSVEDLSAAVGLSRGHLYKKLMSITGKSPIEFIRILRIKRGKQLLEQSGRNISQAAYEVGMSPKQFSKFFKEEYGMLPSDYMKKEKG